MLVALLVPNDLWHEQAVTLWEAIKAAGHTGLYFDCVVAESVSAAVRRLHEKGRADKVEALLDRLDEQAPKEIVTWILSDAPRLYPGALELIRSSSGAMNFNDALIANETCFALARSETSRPSPVSTTILTHSPGCAVWLSRRM